MLSYLRITIFIWTAGISLIRKKIPSSQLLLFLYTPYPGTPLYDLSLKMGFKKPQFLEAWGEFYLDVPTVPWIDNHLVQRVRANNKSLYGNPDITLKYKDKFKFNPRMYTNKTQYLFSRFSEVTDKKQTLLKYLKRRVARSE